LCPVITWFVFGITASKEGSIVFTAQGITFWIAINVNRLALILHHSMAGAHSVHAGQLIRPVVTVNGLHIVTLAQGEAILDPI
ncbi:hypothetical protein, partial [Aeromonas veronii]|uniref:hypothetical protein n=1 Tax=Aeromonas veronii TaxID=654 RepID=UPI001957527B